MNKKKEETIVTEVVCSFTDFLYSQKRHYNALCWQLGEHRAGLILEIDTAMKLGRGQVDFHVRNKFSST